MSGTSSRLTAGHEQSELGRMCARFRHDTFGRLHRRHSAVNGYLCAGHGGDALCIGILPPLITPLTAGMGAHLLAANDAMSHPIADTRKTRSGDAHHQLLVQACANREPHGSCGGSCNANAGGTCGTQCAYAAFLHSISPCTFSDQVSGEALHCCTLAQQPTNEAKNLCHVQMLTPV